MTNLDPKKNEKNLHLNEDDLEQVTGGTGSSTVNTCSNFACVWCGCGKEAGKSGHYCECQGGVRLSDTWFDYTCEWCEHLGSCSLRQG